MASTDAPFQYKLPKNDEVEYVKQKVLESGSSYPSKCRVLLLSVSAGAGKSALINTARAVFNDSYLEHVEQGDDDEDKHLRGSVTEVAQSHPIFHAGVEKEEMDRVRITDTPGALAHGAANDFKLENRALRAVETVLGKEVPARKGEHMYGMVGVLSSATPADDAASGPKHEPFKPKLFGRSKSGHQACCLLVDGAALVSNWEKRLRPTARAIARILLAMVDVTAPVIAVTKLDQVRVLDPKFHFERMMRPRLAQAIMDAAAERTGASGGFGSGGFSVVDGDGPLPYNAASLAARILPIFNLTSRQDYARRTNIGVGPPPGETDAFDPTPRPHMAWEIVQLSHARLLRALLRECARFNEKHAIQSMLFSKVKGGRGAHDEDDEQEEQDVEQAQWHAEAAAASPIGSSGYMPAAKDVDPFHDVEGNDAAPGRCPLSRSKGGKAGPKSNASSSSAIRAVTSFDGGDIEPTYVDDGDYRSTHGREDSSFAMSALRPTLFERPDEVWRMVRPNRVLVTIGAAQACRTFTKQGHAQTRRPQRRQLRKLFRQEYELKPVTLSLTDTGFAVHKGESQLRGEYTVAQGEGGGPPPPDGKQHHEFSLLPMTAGAGAAPPTPPGARDSPALPASSFPVQTLVDLAGRLTINAAGLDEMLVLRLSSLREAREWDQWIHQNMVSAARRANESRKLDALGIFEQSEKAWLVQEAPER